MEFARQYEMAKVKEELLNNVLADEFNKSNLEEEVDMVTGQVLAELGMELDEKMVGFHAPSKVLRGGNREDQGLMDALPELRTQLNVL